MGKNQKDPGYAKCYKCKHSAIIGFDEETGTYKSNKCKPFLNNECDSRYNVKFEPATQPTYRLTEKYKDGFSLVDIAKHKPCWDEFIKAMVHLSIKAREKYSWQMWSKTKVIQNNIPWLIEKGFIEEDKPQERWVNIYELDDGAGWNMAAIHTTKEEAVSGAKMAKDRKYVATIKLPDKTL